VEQLRFQEGGFDMSASSAGPQTGYYTGGETREGLEQRGPRYRPPTEAVEYRRGWSAWKLAGLAIVALGIVGFFYLEPDLRRYLKIRNM
jgi:hypothetical protein